MKKTILLLDDKESIAKVVAVYLSGEYDVVYFDNALKGIQWLQEGNKPDLIISDIRMPVMRGDEFLEYVKNNELFKSFPVIILSSEESTSERIRLLEVGASDYIVKPFNPMELKIRIRKNAINMILIAAMNIGIGSFDRIINKFFLIQALLNTYPINRQRHKRWSIHFFPGKKLYCSFISVHSDSPFIKIFNKDINFMNY
mgnify:CR=1 FL=1